MSNKPIRTDKFTGAGRISWWQNATNEGRTYFSFQMQRSVKNQNGDYEYTNSFFAEHIPSLIDALKDGYTAIKKANSKIVQDRKPQAQNFETAKAKADTTFDDDIEI